MGEEAQREPQARPLRAAWAGFAGLLVGMGLGRLAYAPLVAAVIQAGWFPPAAALSLGVAGTAGYLVGAFAVIRFAERLPVAPAMRISMLAVAAGFFACARPGPLPWFLAWTFISGAAGAVAVIAGLAAVLAAAPKGRKALTGGAATSGLGAGVILSGWLVPRLAEASLAAAWLGLGTASLVLALAAWGGWPPAPGKARGEEKGAAAAAAAGAAAGAQKREGVRLQELPRPVRRALQLGFVSYGLASLSIAFVQLMLADFVVRGLGRSLSEAGFHWQWMGAGALLGPLLIGALGDRIGAGAAYRLSIVGFGLAVLSLLAGAPAMWLAVCAFALGVFNFGQMAPLAARQRVLLGEDDAAARRAWGIASTGFGFGQVAGGALYVALLEGLGSYPLLVAVSAGFSCLAAVAEQRGARLAADAPPRQREKG